MSDVLWVFAPVAEPQLQKFEDGFVRPTPADRQALVGFVADYPVTEDADGLSMATRDFPDYQVGFVTFGSKERPGYAGAFYCLAIMAKDMPEASALPGFTPIISYTGSHKTKSADSGQST